MSSITYLVNGQWNRVMCSHRTARFVYLRHVWLYFCGFNLSCGFGIITVIFLCFFFRHTRNCTVLGGQH